MHVSFHFDSHLHFKKEEQALFWKYFLQKKAVRAGPWSHSCHPWHQCWNSSSKAWQHSSSLMKPEAGTALVQGGLSMLMPWADQGQHTKPTRCQQCRIAPWKPGHDVFYHSSVAHLCLELWQLVVCTHGQSAPQTFLSTACLYSSLTVWVNRGS